jgi:hypothetical protein
MRGEKIRKSPKRYILFILRRVHTKVPIIRAVLVKKKTSSENQHNRQQLDFKTLLNLKNSKRETR